MEKIKSLNRYQKGVLIFMIAMALVFAVIYPMTISQVGFEYKNTILVPSQEDGSTVYSGKIQGKQHILRCRRIRPLYFSMAIKPMALIQQKKTLQLFRGTKKWQNI